jgi:hypothetical protein
LTEAVIMLCLLSFTWLVAAYMITLAENRVRCAAVGRHAAWMRAHGAPFPVPDPNSTVTPQDVSSNAMRQPPVQADEAGAAIAPSVKAFILGMLTPLGLNTIPIQHVEQRLNINNADDRWLYQIDNTDFPIMREVYNGVGLVGIATCEWANVETLLENRVSVAAALVGLGIP